MTRFISPAFALKSTIDRASDLSILYRPFNPSRMATMIEPRPARTAVLDSVTIGVAIITAQPAIVAPKPRVHVHRVDITSPAQDHRLPFVLSGGHRRDLRILKANKAPRLVTKAYRGQFTGKVYGTTYVTVFEEGKQAESHAPFKATIRDHRRGAYARP